MWQCRSHDLSHPWASSSARLLSVSIRAFTFQPWGRGRLSRSAEGSPSAPPPRVLPADLSDPGGPVRQGCAFELVVEPVQEGMDAGREADRGRAGKSLVREAEERAVGVGGELPTHDALLSLRELLSGLDVPFVLEEPRRLPREDLPRHMVLGRATPVVDAPSLARFEASPRHVPTREMLGLGEGLPHDVNRMADASLECDGGVVALERKRTSPRGAWRRHVDSVSWLCVP